MQGYNMSISATFSVIFALLFFWSGLASSDGVYERFDEYRVYRVFPKTLDQLNLVKSFEYSAEDNVSVWSWVSGPNVGVDVMVSPETETEILLALRESGISYEIWIEDVQSLIDIENPEIGDSMHGQRNRRNVDEITPFNWTAYHRLDEIYTWLDGLAYTYPDWVEVLDIGLSYEGRSIKGIKITFNESNPGVLVEGGAHGQEWISPATVTFLIDVILSGTNETFNPVARAHNWFIFPILNVDGYEYTFTTNRLWRKTRKPFANNCTGVDLNRNWDFHWMANDGASQDPCSEAFAGPEPFSEVEAKAFADYIASIKDQFYIFLSFHSYGYLVLVPYSYTYEHPANYNESIVVGAEAIAALKTTFGATYVLGSFSGVEYVSSGGSADYMKGLGTRFVYTIELRDDAEYGWLVPADQIIYSANETIVLLTALIGEAHKIAYEDTV